MNNLKNYYAILGLKDSSASLEQIRSAYRKLIKQCHPDINKDPNAALMTKELNEADSVLSDPETKAAYDAEYEKVYGKNQPGNAAKTYNFKEYAKEYNAQVAKERKANIEKFITPIRDSNRQNQPVSDGDFRANDFYGVLGLRFTDNPSDDDIFSAHGEKLRAASKEHGYFTPPHMEAVKKYNDAYSVLSDADAKRELDMYLTRYYQQREEEQKQHEESHREREQYGQEHKTAQSKQPQPKESLFEKVKDLSVRVKEWLGRTGRNIAALTRMSAIERHNIFSDLSKDIVLFDKGEKKYDAMANSWNNYWQHLDDNGKYGKLKQKRKADLNVANMQLDERWDELTFRIDNILGNDYQFSNFSKKALKTIERIADTRQNLYNRRFRAYEARQNAAATGKPTEKEIIYIESEREILCEEAQMIQKWRDQLRAARSKERKQNR